MLGVDINIVVDKDNVKLSSKDEDCDIDITVENESEDVDDELGYESKELACEGKKGESDCEGVFGEVETLVGA